MSNKTDLWCVRHQGSDDLFAAKSKGEAEATSAKHNAWAAERFPNDPLGDALKTVVEPWPWTAEGHAESLREQDRIDAEFKSGINPR